MPNNVKQITTLVAALACGLLQSSAFATGKDDALVKRGAYLVGLGGCIDCHTPLAMGANGPEKDMARGLSGHPEAVSMPMPPKLGNEWAWAGSATATAYTGPWRTTYAANLTPDRETGIGAWTKTDFIQTLRTGKHLGAARPILPPMPWQALSALPDNDLQAIYAYLMAQPAVKNKVPDYAPPPNVTAKAGG